MNILEDDATGEIKLVNNNWFMVTGTSEIMQAIKQNLETVLGEVWLDTSIGVPWFDEIFEKGTSQKKTDAILINEIASTPGVISLAGYSSEIDQRSRTITVEFQAYTVEGILDFSQILTPGGA